MPVKSSPLDASYSTVIASVRNRLDAVTATTTTLTEGAVGAAAGTGGGSGVFYIDPADYALGRAPKLRLRMVGITNATAPVSDFTIALYPITPAGGAAAAVSVTLGTVVPGSSATLTAPALTTATTIDSGDFACPVAGLYVIALTISANMVASSSIAVRAQLSARAV